MVAHIVEKVLDINNKMQVLSLYHSHGVRDCMSYAHVWTLSLWAPFMKSCLTDWLYMHCYTILSHIAWIHNGLSFPPDFGISTRFTAFGLCHPSSLRAFFTNSLSEILATSSMSNLSKLAVLLPLLLLMFLYMPILYFSQTKLFLLDC